MKREHSAYFEYFVEPVSGSTQWAWRTLVHRLPASAGPTEELKGLAKDELSARLAGAEAGEKAMEKHRKPQGGAVAPIEEGK